MSEFRKSTITEFEWWDACCCFKCECGNEIVVDQDDGETACRCGKTYRIVASLEVRDGL